MSALAGIMNAFNKKVSGSDTSLVQAEKLAGKGVRLFNGYRKNNLGDSDIVIYNLAISPQNIELIEAKKRNLTTVNRAVFLGYLSRIFENVIAISGTHGKTTTTAMIGAVLVRAGLLPTIHLGGNCEALGGNYRLGANKYFVTEACEYQDSFLTLSPKIGVITNIENEHMDYYKNKNNLFNSFSKFAKQGEQIIVPYKIKEISEKSITIGSEKWADYSSQKVRCKNGNYSFLCCKRGEDYLKIDLNIPGRFNVDNALSCIATCDLLGIDKKYIYEALKDFNNVDRRFQVLYAKNEKYIIQDYAHHPTEIKNCIEIAKGKYKKVICFFQPHTYSRTKTLFKNFLKCFNKSDLLYLLPTYASREEYDNEGSAEYLCASLKKQRQCDMVNTKEIKKICKNSKNTAILFVGAGDINLLADKCVKVLKKNDEKVLTICDKYSTLPKHKKVRC